MGRVGVWARIGDDVIATSNHNVIQMAHGSIEVFGRATGSILAILSTKVDGGYSGFITSRPISMNSLQSQSSECRFFFSISSSYKSEFKFSWRTNESSMASTFRKARRLEVARATFSVNSKEVSKSHSHSQAILRDVGVLLWRCMLPVILLSKNVCK